MIFKNNRAKQFSRLSAETNTMKQVIFLLLLISSWQLSAQHLPYAKKHYNLQKGMAIQGYDPVSYFKANSAEKGKESIVYNHNGIVYYFSSQANKQAFIENPAKYEPQYGGYCAYAMADGDKVKIDPETFKIVDGKLYLFYNFRLTNTLKLWNKEETELLPKAEMEWLKIIKN